MKALRSLVSAVDDFLVMVRGECGAPFENVDAERLDSALMRAREVLAAETAERTAARQSDALIKELFDCHEAIAPAVWAVEKSSREDWRALMRRHVTAINAITDRLRHLEATLSVSPSSAETATPGQWPIEVVRAVALAFSEGYRAGFDDAEEGDWDDADRAWDRSKASARLAEVPVSASPALREQIEAEHAFYAAMPGNMVRAVDVARRLEILLSAAPAQGTTKESKQ